MKENYLIKYVDIYYGIEEILMIFIEVSIVEDTLLNFRNLNKTVMKFKDDGNILMNFFYEVMKFDDVYVVDDILVNFVDLVDKVLKFKFILCFVFFCLN